MFLFPPPQTTGRMTKGIFIAPNNININAIHKKRRVYNNNNKYTSSLQKYATYNPHESNNTERGARGLENKIKWNNLNGIDKKICKSVMRMFSYGCKSLSMSRDNHMVSIIVSKPFSVKDLSTLTFTMGNGVKDIKYIPSETKLVFKKGRSKMSDYDDDRCSDPLNDVESMYNYDPKNKIEEIKKLIVMCTTLKRTSMTKENDIILPQVLRPVMCSIIDKMYKCGMIECLFTDLTSSTIGLIREKIKWKEYIISVDFINHRNVSQRIVALKNTLMAECNKSLNDSVEAYYLKDVSIVFIPKGADNQLPPRSYMRMHFHLSKSIR